MAAARRIVLACWGSLGDLFPSLAIAIGLRDEGHRPVVAAPALYREIVEAQGVDFHPVPPDVDPTDTALMHRLMDPRTGSQAIVGEVLGRSVRESYDALSQVVPHADVVVSHPVTFAAPLAARAHGIPWLSTVLAPASLFSVHDFPLLGPYPQALRIARVAPLLARGVLALMKRETAGWTMPVRALRAKLGLGDVGDPLYEGQFSPQGTLALFSSQFARPQPDWPPRARVTGFVFHDGDNRLSDDLRAFLDAGDPPIVFTLGSSAAETPGQFYEESARAAEALGRRAVFLVGRSAAVRPADTGRGQFISTFAPHAPLFARAAAVVHHGGIGTLAQAMRAGRPMLVVPHAHDQPDNAVRAERMGIARVVPARAYQQARVARALDALCASRTIADQAAVIGRQVSLERGTAVAVQAILDVAAVGDRP